MLLIPSICMASNNDRLPRNIHKIILAGAQRLFGKTEVNVTIENEGVSWVLSAQAKFIVRICESETIAEEAVDLAAFMIDSGKRSNIIGAPTRFVCHNLDRAGAFSDEFYYLLSILSGDSQSFCFCLETRQYVSTNYDEKTLFEKERLIIGLSTLTPSRRVKVTRIFSEPIPADVSTEGELLAQLSRIPVGIHESFCNALCSRGYEEVKKEQRRT